MSNIRLDSYLARLEGAHVSNECLYFEDGDGKEQVLPLQIVLCENCRGRGSHLQSSLRDIAFSQEDQDYDPEFMEEMREGCYDQECYDCCGQGRIYVLAEQSESSPAFQAYQEAKESARDFARWDREDAAIRRMESGGYY